MGQSYCDGTHCKWSHEIRKDYEAPRDLDLCPSSGVEGSSRDGRARPCRAHSHVPVIEIEAGVGVGDMIKHTNKLKVLNYKNAIQSPDTE